MISLILPTTKYPNSHLKFRSSGYSFSESSIGSYDTPPGHEYTERFSDRKLKLHATLAAESRKQQLAYELRVLAEMEEELAECVDPVKMVGLKRKVGRQRQNVKRWR